MMAEPHDAIAVLERQMEESSMRATLLISILAFTASATLPALAADEYYIVQDTSTKKCTVVQQKPTSTTTTIVGDGTVYKTKTEADTALKSVKVCTSN
jgi:hypothetical protein